jgi:hypothetical protein
MPKGGRRYSLLMYEYMLDRWWPTTLVLGVALIGLWWPVSRHPLGQMEPWRSIGMLTTGGFVLIVTAFLFLIRKAAYVQPFRDHLRLVTPFLRMNISYKRFHRTSTVDMRTLFLSKKLSGWKRDLIRPIAGKTAIVIELTGHPVSPLYLRFFLSPFFFKDNSPHFVILVRDWMRFSTEIESLRFSSSPVVQQPKDGSILSRPPSHRA